MAKKKSKNKRKTTTQTLKQQSEVRLSQCMIVKNEEENIERALEWAKGFAFEQIVVDTGSTDRTVDLAGKAGAKVYHFEWINDFAAAKNYAMDLAKGDWIAILDADEYMSREDVKALMTILKRIESDPVASRECDAITCPFVNIDDKGNVNSVINHQRIFRNRPYLRFEGKIHEVVKLRNNHFIAENIRIMHTGYTQAVYADAGKMERNIAMLRSEHEKDRNDPDVMLYLADSLKVAGTKEALDEAETLFHKALASERKGNVFVKQLAYNFLIPRYSSDAEKKKEAIKLCDEAIADLPDYIDYYYYRGSLYNQLGNFKAAKDNLSVCERAFTKGPTIPSTLVLVPSPLPLFHQLYLSAQGLGDLQGELEYSTMIKTMLTEGKNQADILGPYIRAMSFYGTPDDEIFGKLSEVYNLGDLNDLMFVARAAKDSGAIEFTREVMKRASEIMGRYI